MPRQIDLLHLGRDRVIAAYEVEGAIVDPGPASCVEALLAGLGDMVPRALLLTHIHLDHAGAAGTLVRRFPRLKVYVHEVGAPHLIEPARLLASAERLYGDRMQRLWGEVAAVPRANVTVLRGGETAEGLQVAHVPGHATHHVAYLHEASGDAYVGDVAGVRIPPHDFTLMPTPPPDVDLEKWRDSLHTVEAWRPRRLWLTHFGPVDDPEAHLQQARDRLAIARERGRGTRASFLRRLKEEVTTAVDEATADRLRQAAPPEHQWLGLERYWQGRSERATPAAGVRDA